MKADTTRTTFKKAKHYNQVVMQQGRVQLDADWNEQLDITRHRIETETIDVVGKCGAPMHSPGFHIVDKAADLKDPEEKNLPENQNPPVPAAGDLLISGGRYYVDGILCENDQITTYTRQPDLPDTPVIADDGVYLAYLDVWSRHLTAIEDPSIREVALGGPDTCTRAKTVWQVKLFRVGPPGLPGNCSTVFNSWNEHIAAGTGKLAARTATSAPSNEPCIVAPGAGFRRLQNQHYRVEVHLPGALGTATFKWSRDNGSIVTRWESQNVNDLTVSSAGRDKVLNFASGQWVELIDDTRELLGKPGALVQLAKVEGNVLTVNPATATEPVDITKFPRNPRVRRWDMVTILKPVNQDWQDLEDGVQVQFTNGTYKTGDYWLIPARTATADVEWPLNPVTNLPETLSPFGIHHHYCRLAVARKNGAVWTLTDCRNIFPPLTELIDFHYVGGDGQEAMPDLTKPAEPTPLGQPLEAGVTNGRWPVAGAVVRFRVTKGTGVLRGNLPQIFVLTDANGIASVEWSIDSQNANQQVEAVLMGDDANPICLPIHYNANPSIASQVAYDPGRSCQSLQGQKTVQKAIETLSSLASLYEVSGNNQSLTPGGKLDPLVVVAASKCGPTREMEVAFTVVAGDGKVSIAAGPLGSTVSVRTNAQGLASCDWTLGVKPGTQIVEAVLKPGPNDVVPPTSVRFYAQVGAGAEPGFRVKAIEVRPNGLPRFTLDNNMDVRFPQLRSGIEIICDDRPDPKAFLSKHPNHNPVCFITVDVPYPFVTEDRNFYDASPVCFETITLGGKLEVNDTRILWMPTPEAARWIDALFRELKEAKLPERVLTRLVLKSNFIWSATNPDLFLDGELFAARTLDKLILPSGDQRRGGTLEMFFWLISPPRFLLGAVGEIDAVRGLLTDVNGAVVPAAKVNLIHSSGTQQSTVTDAEGRFLFRNVAPGGYEVNTTVSEVFVQAFVFVGQQP